MHYFLLDEDSNIVQIYISGATSNPMPYFKDFGMGTIGTVHKVEFTRVDSYEDEIVKSFDLKKATGLSDEAILKKIKDKGIKASPVSVLSCGNYSMGADLTIDMQHILKNYVQDMFDVVDAISFNDLHYIVLFRKVISDETFLALLDKDKKLQGMTKTFKQESRSVLDELKYGVETYGLTEDYFNEIEEENT